jgi:hypothetical protein
MATSRSNLPKEMTPFGLKPAKKAGKKPKPFGFAKGGSVYDSPTHMAASASNPPSNNPLDDGEPSGGGVSRGGGAAIKGKKFQGVF